MLTCHGLQREELRDTRVMTPLLLDSNLLSERGAQSRLAESEAKYAYAKANYQRPSSSASIYRPGANSLDGTHKYVHGLFSFVDVLTDCYCVLTFVLCLLPGPLIIPCQHLPIGTSSGLLGRRSRQPTDDNDGTGRSTARQKGECISAAPDESETAVGAFLVGAALHRCAIVPRFRSGIVRDWFHQSALGGGRAVFKLYLLGPSPGVVLIPKSGAATQAHLVLPP